MKIVEQFKAKRCVFSIECFPPKQTTQMEKLRGTLFAMKDLQPDFISVTFGAGGSAGGVSTVEVADLIQNELGIPALAHLICMGNDKTSAAKILDELEQVGVHDVLALRGDRTPNRPESPDFAHACDLTAFIKSYKPGFSVHGACYPEGHPEAENLRQDVENLCTKQAAGAEHLVTQLFFDNMHFYRFLNLARRAGITLPVSAGVMPIVKRSQIERTVALSSASLPSDFTRMISRWQDDPAALYEAGIDYAVRQLRDLIEGGADGVHLYAMNDAAVAKKVYDGIRDLL
ncbi:methylenetetrahydrofolate reductase [Subdoligranulum variabile]|uniref:Methylenetetrahydrofolate reductase n=1 Tax=Subdoligranulum variabile DSM 15176 TaxID=411471 RepID=D1PME0_9FIRM|nr:methylenetetrahydrofolate reductase [Subdoligranulum variabile]EFB75725.1 methylenetetrahydrofolate reductase (NAD(P)H) [Subdoligranulum variabile DSM 15176]UWP68422.1 methylenetetrahydrofolate reductase [Subdoligranulum variabile]